MARINPDISEHRAIAGEVSREITASTRRHLIAADLQSGLLEEVLRHLLVVGLEPVSMHFPPCGSSEVVIGAVVFGWRRADELFACRPMSARAAVVALGWKNLRHTGTRALVGVGGTAEALRPVYNI